MKNKDWYIIAIEILIGIIGLLLLDKYFTEPKIQYVPIVQYRYFDAPTPTPPKCYTMTERYGAICVDGWRSNATGSGACSHHRGVSRWLTTTVKKCL